jgi:RNA polymerase sigma-70 factor, ECF subfamily
MSDSRAGSLYRRYGAAIYARCRTLLRDRADAEDATQETFVRVFKHLESAIDDAHAKHWIYRVATNVCIDNLRVRSRALDPTAFATPGSLERSLEEILADQEIAGAIISRAPEKLRDVAWLTYVDGLDAEEVAKMLDVTGHTVRNRLADFLKRARKFIQRELT